MTPATKATLVKAEQNFLLPPSLDCVTPVISKNEAAYLLSWADTRLSVCPFDKHAGLSVIKKLSEVQWPETFSVKKILMLGVAHFLIRQNCRSVDIFDSILANHPRHRSALIYRWIAVETDLFAMSRDKVLSVGKQTRDLLKCDRDDVFGRLCHIASGFSFEKFTVTLQKLENVVEENPQSAMAWAILASFHQS